jgi:hypothetical protein
MRKLLSLLLTTSLLAAACPALAQDWHDHGDRYRHDERHDDWHWHGDIHHFSEYDMEYWRGGHWIHDFHDGRDGWWWVADGFWYYYPAPIYPYPDPYTPPGVVVETVPGAASSYYYCGNPAGYYPYVPQCAVAWQRIVTEVAAPPQQVIVAPTPQPAPAPVAAGRDADYRQLNIYADEFHHIDPSDPHAIAKLKILARKVETFRKSLYKRSYNAMDVLKDADDLKHRIAVERSDIAKHTVVVAPPPSSLPPGSTVVFPTK